MPFFVCRTLWNVLVMAGAITATMGPEAEAHILEMEQKAKRSLGL